MADKAALSAPPTTTPDISIDDDDAEWGRPDSSKYLELPVTSFVEWDNVGEVKNAIRSLRAGYFRDSALLVDQMFEDDRVAGDMTTRCSGLLGAPIQIDPAKPTKQAGRIADALEKLWPQMFSDAAVSDLLRWGLMLGVGVGELIWDTAGDVWVPRLKVWHPQFVNWRWDTRSYWLQTQTKAYIELPRTDENIHSDGHWVVFTPFGFSRGWLRGLVRELAMPWLSRQWAYRDWNRFNETNGIPARKAYCPPQAEDKQKRIFMSKVLNLGNEPAILLPKGGEDNTWDLQYEYLKGQSNYDSFDKLIERAEKSISIAIVGQDASNRAQGGSLAQFKGDIAEKITRFDAKCVAQTLVQQAVYWWTGHNFGSSDLVPKMVYDVEPPEDEKDSATALLALSQALPGLQAVGVDTQLVCEAKGLPIREGFDLPEPGTPGTPGGPPIPPPAPMVDKDGKPAPGAAAKPTAPPVAAPKKKGKANANDAPST